MKKTLLFAISIAAFGAVMSGCSCNGPSDEALAVQAAKAYYDQLLQGDYASFVEGTNGYDSVPGYYKEQLLTGMKQFLAQQKAEHVGIDSVVPLRAKVDTVGNNTVAKAFLKLCYADSTKEEIVVPMIKRNDVWYMR